MEAHFSKFAGKGPRPAGLAPMPAGLAYGARRAVLDCAQAITNPLGRFVRLNTLLRCATSNPVRPCQDPADRLFLLAAKGFRINACSPLASRLCTPIRVSANALVSRLLEPTNLEPNLARPRRVPRLPTTPYLSSSLAGVTGLGPQPAPCRRTTEFLACSLLPTSMGRVRRGQAGRADGTTPADLPALRPNDQRGTKCGRMGQQKTLPRNPGSGDTCDALKKSSQPALSPSA